MLVKFKAPWFAPTELETRDHRTVSGRRFKKGVQEVPDSLRPHLPSSAEVIEKAPVVEEEKKEESLKDHDVERAAGEEVAKVTEKAEKSVTEKRRENMAKARKALEAQKEAKGE